MNNPISNMVNTDFTFEDISNISNLMGFGVIVYSIKGKPIFINDFVSTYLGYSSLVDVDNVVVIPKEESFKCSCEECEFIPKIVRGDINHYTFDKKYNINGKQLWARVTATKISWKGLTHIVTMLQDITEVKLYQEKLILAKEEMEELIYLTSHDLRGPTNSIRSLIDMFNIEYRKTIKDKGGNGIKYLDFISKSVNRSKNLIDNLLDYSTTLKSTEDKKKEHINIKNILVGICEDLETYNNDHNFEIKLEIEVNVIFAHKSEIYALFQNLISNAIKYSKKNHKNLITIKSDIEGDNWIFHVSDTGLGIEEKYFNKIFLVFKRLHTKEEIEGTGIGLAHCKKILELHNGEIEVDSVYGEGSVFRVTIPITGE